MAKNFIRGAIKRPGALTAKAKARGMTPTQFCSQPKDKLSKLSKQQCNLFRTLKRINK